MSLDVVTLGVVCADVMARPVDRFPELGQLSLVPHLGLHLGGLAGVTATVLCQLGGRAAHIGAVGADGFGDFIINVLKTNGVQVDAVRRCPEHGSSVTLVFVTSEGERSFIHHVGATATLCEDSVDPSLLKRTKVLHWGGPSITPGLDGAPIGRVFKKARDLGLRTSMDTCYDGQGLWFQHIEHALPHLDLVMSSLEEAQGYTGQQTPEGIADFYRSFGVETVVVKLGADGLYLKDSHEARYLPAYQVPVADTTGAGDAACAGFLYGYTHGWSLNESGRLANAVGGLTVQTMGGAEAIHSLKETQTFMAKFG